MNKSLDLSYVVTVKSTVEILQTFVAFLEYIDFNLTWIIPCL
jgi:hypothetical protein